MVEKKSTVEQLDVFLLEMTAVAKIEKNNFYFLTNITGNVEINVKLKYQRDI